MTHKHLFTTILAVLLLAAGGSGAWAQDFTVTNSGSTFTVTRSGSSLPAQSVCYRTVSLSAIAGQHFTAASGTLTFAADETSKTVTVTESTPGTDAYKYQTATSRTYRFEVTDLGGYVLASKDRTVSSGLTQFSGTKVSSSVSNLVTMSSANFSSGMSSSKYLDVSYTPPTSQVETSGTLSGYVLIDDSYDYAQKPATVSTSTLISSTGATAAYLNSLGYKIYATVCFTEKEKDDGYQYLQIVAGTSSASYDTGADPNGAVNDPSNSAYKVCFEFADGSNAEGKIYFPHRGTTSSEFSNSAGVLHQQKYKSDDYNAAAPSSCPSPRPASPPASMPAATTTTPGATRTSSSAWPSAMPTSPANPSCLPAPTAQAPPSISPCPSARLSPSPTHLTSTPTGATSTT